MADGVERSASYEFGGFVLMPLRRSLTRNGERVALTPRVFDVLLALVERNGEVVTKEELLTLVWSDANVEEGNINRTVSTLRKHLGRQSDGSDMIETVPKVGYRFVAPVVSKKLVPATISASSKNVPSRAIRLGPWIAVAVAAVLIGSLVGGSLYFAGASLTTGSITKNVIEPLTRSDSQELIPSFAADGRIRFARLEGKNAYSYIADSNGSNARRDTSIAGLITGLWSPDGARVYYRKEGADGLFLANSDGSNEIRLPFEAGNSAWSYDSKKLVYQSRVVGENGAKNFDIFIYSLESGTSENVVSHPGFDGDPAFSPDGRSIVFVSDRDGNIEIYRKDLLAGQVARLTNSPGHDSYPSYSPDGTLIVFNSDRERENTDVYAMRTDGSGLFKVTDLPSTESVGSSPWSADGTRLLVLSDKDGVESIHTMNFDPFAVRAIDTTGDSAMDPDVAGDGKIVYFAGNPNTGGTLELFNPKTGQRQKLTDISKGTGHARFSPDSSSVVFNDAIGGNTEVFSIKADGSERRNLTQNAATDQSAAWSNDGRTIAFATNRGGDLQRFEIWEMNADGTQLRMKHRDLGSSVEPAFMNDGRLLFANDSVGGRDGNFELFRSDSNSNKPVRLTDRRKFDVSPAPSPDGKQIAFTSNSDGNSEIYVMNVNGSNLLRLTRDAGEDIAPVWSPDGKHILFSSNRTGKFRLYEVSVPTN